MARGYIRQRSKVRKDSWSIQVFLGVDPETKKRRYYNESVRGSRSEAERRLTELLHEMDGGSLVRTPDLTFGAFLEEWYRDYVSTSVRARTAQGYRENMDRYVIPSLGGVPLDRLAPRHIQAMESSLLRGDGAGRRGLSAATVMQAHRVVSGALGHAVRMGVLSRNPVQSVKPPRVPRYEARSLTWEEVGTLMEHIEDPGRRMLVMLALQTGLRRSELLGAAVAGRRLGIVHSCRSEGADPAERGEDGAHAPEVRPGPGCGPLLGDGRGAPGVPGRLAPCSRE